MTKSVARGRFYFLREGGALGHDPSNQQNYKTVQPETFMVYKRRK